jgi:hypothetical protein
MQDRVPKAENSSFVKTIDGIMTAMERMKVRIRVDLDPANVACVGELLDELETLNLLEHLQSGRIDIYVGRVFDCSEDGSCKCGSGLYNMEQFCTRAIGLLEEFIAENTDITRVEMIMAREQAASQRVVIKSGYKKEGLMKEYMKIGNRFHDCCLYAKIVK